MSFAGKVVVVTGASIGIGEAIAILFAKEGAEVALVARNEERLQKIAVECNSYGKKALTVKANFSNEDEVGTIIPKVIERFGKIDVLVNNASILVQDKILDDSFRNNYNEVMKVNLTVPILLTCDAAPYLVKTKGSVVNISCCPAHDVASYSVSKAGLDNFTRCAALELGGSGVRVNSINLGVVRTTALSTLEGSEAVIETLTTRSALQKIAEPEEVAELTLFLASSKARSITGENYVLDNGVTLKAASYL